MGYCGFHRAIGILHDENRETWPICFGNEVRVDAIDALRRRIREERGEAPSYTALIVKAIAKAIDEVRREYPEVSSVMLGRLFWKRIHYFDRMSAGVAISREYKGMDVAMCGVVEDPERTGLLDMTRQLQSMATLPTQDVPIMRNCHYLFRLPWIAQKLMLWVGKNMPEMRRQYRGTFTLTSVGKFGVDYQLTLPQASCLQFGFGAIKERPVVEDGKVVPARTVFLTLSFDRRLMNGKPVSMVMQRTCEIIANAELAVEPETTPASAGASADSEDAKQPAPQPAAAGGSI